MADTSHHDSSEVLHYHASGEQAKRHSAPVALTIIAILLAVAAGFLAFKLKQQTAALEEVRAQLTQANSSANAVNADLTTANAKSANLQAELDKSKGAQADLMAQLKKNEEQGAALQSQLDQARTDVKSQQEKAQSQTADLQAQLKLATDSSTGLQKELATAKSQIDNLNGQIAKAKADVAQPPPVAAAPKTLPLTTEFKKAFFGGSFTLQIKNTGTDSLNLNISITGSDKTPSRTATIEGGGTLKIDGMAAGANVVISSDGFQSLTLLPQ